MTLETPLWLQAASGDATISYSARQWRIENTARWPVEGVIGPGSLLVSQRAAGANMSVDVSAGVAVINGDSIADQGAYLVRNTAVVNVTVPAAPGSGTRTHRLVAQVRDKQSDGGSSYDWLPVLLADTGAGLPAQPSSAITLAKITVSAGQSSVTTSMIDMLTRTISTALLGTMTGTSLPTGTFVGETRYDTGNGDICVWNGTIWQRHVVNPTYPRGRIVKKALAASLTLASSTSEQQILSQVITCDPTRTYRVDASVVFGNQPAAGELWFLNLKVGSTVCQAVPFMTRLSAIAGLATEFLHFQADLPSVSGSQTVTLTATRLSGANTLQIITGGTGTSTYITVDDILGS